MDRGALPFFCAGVLIVCAVAGGVFGLWLLAGLDRYVLLINGGGGVLGGVLWSLLLSALPERWGGVVTGCARTPDPGISRVVCLPWVGAGVRLSPFSLLLAGFGGCWLQRAGA